MVTDVPHCLAKHRADARACAVPRAVSIEPAYAALERSIAAADGASLVETTKWTCSGDPCMPIKGKILIWRDSHHITVVMAKSTAPRWATAVRSILNG